MFRWLSALGRTCARRAKTVLALWGVLILGAAGAALALSTGTTASYSVPDADYERVLDRLGAEIEEYAGGTVLTVLTTQSGDQFTEAQRRGVAELAKAVEELDVVLEARDPFAQEEEIADAQAETSQASEDLREAAAELEEAEDELASGRENLETQQVELDQGVAELAELEAQLGPENPLVAQAQAETAAGQQQLDEATTELEAAETEIAEGWADHQESVAELERAERMLELTGQISAVSQGGTVALLSLQVDEEAHSLSSEQREAIITVIEQNLPEGTDADYALELVQDVTTILGPSEIIGLAVAVLVLLIALGTVVAAGLPVLLALVGTGVGVAAIYAATGWVEMTDTDPILALMLGLSLGLDYTLLLLWRYRGVLARGMDPVDAAAEAVGTAGTAIFFAGVTNVIALAALVVTGIPFLVVMGLAASVTVVVVVTAVLTLGPALAALLGRRLLSAGQRRAQQEDAGAPLPTPENNRLSATEQARLSPDQRERLFDSGWGRLITRHPWLAILVPLLMLGTAAIPATDLRLGLPDGGSEPVDSTAYIAFDTIREHFGPGENGPLLGAVTFSDGLEEAEQDHRMMELSETLSGREEILSAAPAGQNQDGTVQVLQVTPETGPNDEETQELVLQLLAEQDALAADHGAESLGWTGQTVANVELAERLLEAIPLYVGIVVLLCLMVLAGVFRSLVTPLLAAAGYVLSLAASLGAVVAIYQWGWFSGIFGVNEPGPILAFLPILICGVLFGLAVDYQLFIMSGVHESHRRGSGPKLAVLEGLRAGGPVVLACGIIMVSVFAGFIFADLQVIRPIGFGLAVGVLVDAFLVRATLIPAVTYLLGRWAWWPQRCSSGQGSTAAGTLTSAE